MAPLKIAMIVSPWFPVPPTGYGGIELVAFNLAQELHRRGHHVTVIGREGSVGPFDVAALAPAEWTTASTPFRAADMFCGRDRSPITALEPCTAMLVGRRSSTRRRSA